MLGSSSLPKTLFARAIRLVLPRARRGLVTSNTKSPETFALYDTGFVSYVEDVFFHLFL